MDSLGMLTKQLVDSHSHFHREPTRATLGAKENSSTMMLEIYSEI